MRILLSILLITTITISCSQNKKDHNISIVPSPKLQELAEGSVPVNKLASPIIKISPDNPDLGREGYELQINPEEIKITANTKAGAFYALQTLEQISLEAEIKELEEIQALTIRDWPEFEWRGGMLDVSRHFFPKDFILKFIDILAYHKLNHFHWHLTDGTEWRLEIDAFPALTD